MSDYNRTTRECPVSQLRPELRQAIRHYFQENQLGDPGAETVLCCETVSEKKSTNELVSWLNGGLDTTIYTGMLLTSQRLIWVKSGDKSGTQLTAAKLEDISAREYVSILPKDTGLEISGYAENSRSQMRGYIAMGSEAAAQKFCDEVKQAITKVKPPPKTGWARWLGG
jgi:hypothetical protein